MRGLVVVPLVAAGLLFLGAAPGCARYLERVTRSACETYAKAALEHAGAAREVTGAFVFLSK